jgi:shikimate dehydrogenase
MGEITYAKFFKLKGLSHTYEALQCNDIIDGVAAMKFRGASGFGVSMPFKQSVIELLDVVMSDVAEYDSCNTVLNLNEQLIGFNTDVYGARHIVSLIPPESGVSILGDGAMGTIFKKLLGDRARVYSRKAVTWASRYEIVDIVINCTSYGTSTPDSPFELLPSVSCVIDLAITPAQLKKQCETANVKYVAGAEFYKHQFQKQFELYTGITLTHDELNTDDQ